MGERRGIRCHLHSFTEDQLDLISRCRFSRKPSIAKCRQAAKSLARRGFIEIDGDYCQLTDLGRVLDEAVWQKERVDSWVEGTQELQPEIRRLTSERDAAVLEAAELRVRLAKALEAQRLSLDAYTGISIA